MKLLQELSLESTSTEGDHIRIVEAVEAACSFLMENQSGGKVTPKGGRSFFNANPGLVAGAAAMAINAEHQYRRNLNMTFTLHAKDPYERRMITSIVDALASSKKYKIKHTRYTNHGKTWVLQPV